MLIRGAIVVGEVINLQPSSRRRTTSILRVGEKTGERCRNCEEDSTPDGFEQGNESRLAPVRSPTVREGHAVTKRRGHQTSRSPKVPSLTVGLLIRLLAAQVYCVPD